MISRFRSVCRVVSAVPSTGVFSRTSRRMIVAVVAAVLSGGAVMGLAQTAHFSGTQNGNFGSVNIGTSGSAIPMVFTFDTAGTLGQTAVLTGGATGLDFTDAGSDTCTANTTYSVGQSCTVNTTFTPRFAGNRFGAVVLENSSGAVFATGFLEGTGAGPQINFLPGTQVVYNSGVITTYNTGPVGIAVDGNGDIYFSPQTSGQVFEMLAVNGVVPASPTLSLPARGFGNTLWMTLDASGNLYIADTVNNAVKEVLAVNGVIPASPTIKTLGSGFSDPVGIAVDENGNVYVTGLLDGTVKEMLSVNGVVPASPTIRVLGGGFYAPTGVAVDSAGDVFVSDENTYLVKELMAVNGSIPASPTIKVLGSGFHSPYGVTLDGEGNLYVADFGNNAVKEILAAGGYATVKTLASGFNGPGAIAVDGAGNVYVGDYGNNRIVKLDLADPPSLAFASTGVGTTSPDSPQIVTIENVGNAALTVPIPSSGDNPSISANFTLNSSGSSACPLLSSESSEPATLAAGATCQLPISFVPTATGAATGSLVLTNNNLNVSAPGYASQSITLNGTGAPGFTLGTSPSTLTMTQGSSATSAITATGQTGFTGTVSLSASGLPSGVTASFSPSSTTGTSVLTLTASSTSVLASALPITIKGTSGPITETTTLLLTVNPANFTLSIAPTSGFLNQGTSLTSTVVVTPQNGFTGSVNLSASNLPGGVTASFSPNPVTGISVLTLTASSTAITELSDVVVTGVSGAEVATASFVLNVYPPAAISVSALAAS